jgi:4-oxalocrotonate tautomerase family enzyme
MPVAHIRVLKGHTRDQLRRLVVDVSDTVARVLEAPKERLEVWVTEIDPDLWGVCGEPASEVLKRQPLEETEMPFIQMVLLAGRTKAQYHALIAEVTQAVANVIGTRKERIRVHIAETYPDNWGIGGVPAAIVRAAEIRAREEAAAAAARASAAE